MAPCLLQAAFLQGMHNFLGPPQATSWESPDFPVSMTVWGIWEQRLLPCLAALVMRGE